MNLLIVFVVIVVSAAEAAKILGIFMIPSFSHQIVYQPIWKELSLRGHDVTIYTPDPINDPTLTNLTEVDMSFSYEVWKTFTATNFDKQSKIEETKTVFKAFAAIFEVQMASPEMQKLLANENQEKYDLLLMEYIYPSMYPFKDVFNCPMVGITSLPLTTGAAELMGMMKHPTLDPDFLLPFSTDLSLRERVISFLMYGLSKVNFYLKMGPSLNAKAKKYFGENTRDVMTIGRETSLVLGNFNYITQNIRPHVPAFVEISGIHLKPEKPLPEDLKHFLDESDEGVVYFSLGTNVKSSLLPKDKLNDFMSAFSKLPYKVLFKFETDYLKNISSVPSNVEIRKWIPQQDVLKHPNIKLFVTQGGLQSIDEALNSKVPMLIIPFFGDQDFNAHKMVKLGVALSLDFDDFTTDELAEKINKVIQNPEYKETAIKLGTIAFDHQVPALEKAIWWIEYVLRHNGAHHLKYKAVTTPFYQYYMLDVYSFLGVVVAITLYLVFKVLKTIINVFRFIRRTLNSNDYSKKSQ